MTKPCFLLLATSLSFAFLCAEEKPDPAELQDETIAEGHSYHGEVFNEGPRQAAVAIPGTGDVHFEVTTTVPNAQKFFDQGIGQLHGFWDFEAQRDSYNDLWDLKLYVDAEGFFGSLFSDNPDEPTGKRSPFLIQYISGALPPDFGTENSLSAGFHFSF